MLSLQTATRLPHSLALSLSPSLSASLSLSPSINLAIRISRIFVSLCRSSLCLGPAFFYCFFLSFIIFFHSILSAGVAFLLRFFLYFLFRKIHSWKEKRVKCERGTWTTFGVSADAPLPARAPALYPCFVVMPPLRCTVSWVQHKSYRLGEPMELVQKSFFYLFISDLQFIYFSFLIFHLKLNK